MPSPRDPTPGRPAKAVPGAVAPEGTRRRFTDRRGGAWDVHEERIPVEEWSTADVDASANGYGVGWLVFACGDVAKRLRLYPAHWHQVPDRELETLCSRARRS